MAESVIAIDPEVMNGMPCFRGTRVPFKNLIDHLEGGHSLDEFLRQFPVVTREMAIQSVEEAKSIVVTAPPDDEPVTEEDRRRLREGRAWLEQRGGKGIPMEDVLADFGLTMDDFPVDRNVPGRD